MMIKQFKYMLGFIATISSYTEATTCYFPGLEGLEERSDSIRIGSSGGFEGFYDAKLYMQITLYNVYKNGITS